jgi:ABC-2 type transport system permease protein
MFDELRKIPIFVARDFRMLLTYKLAFSVSFLVVIFNLFYFVLFGSMFGSTELSILVPYGGDYISYILVGAIGWGFLWTIMETTSASLRREMMIGTLESIFLTRTKIITMTYAYALFGSFFGLLSIFILVVVGFTLFGISVFATANIFTLLIFILSAMMMLGFGMIAGGLTIWLKNIGTTVSLVQSIAMFFSGVYFPIAVLPSFMQPIAKYIPFYYSIEGLRISLQPTTTTESLIHYVIVLLFLSISSIAIGYYILHRGLIKAKKDGSLMFY